MNSRKEIDNGVRSRALMKVLTRTSLRIIIYSFTIVFLGINIGFHPDLILGEKPAVCEAGDKLVNSTEPKICGVPITNEIGTNALSIRKTVK